MKKTLGNALFLIACTYTGVVFAMTAYRWLPGRRESQPVLAISNVKNWVRYTTGGHTLGSAGGQPVIVIFSDFQCPYCRRLAALVDSLHTEYPKAKFIEREYPLDGLHPAAHEAALAAECASDFGRYWEMRHELFASPAQVSARHWVLLASKAGVSDTLQFRECVREGRDSAAVREDITAGDSLGVIGTPTVLVEGTLYAEGAPSRSVLEAAMRKYAR